MTARHFALGSLILVVLAGIDASPAIAGARAPSSSSSSSSSSSAEKDTDPSAAAFVALKKDVEALRGDAERRKFRHHYEKLVVRLQAVANTYPHGSRADDSAFVAAQLLEELAQVSRSSSDRAAAVDAFASMAERFPKSNLADDALVAAARLTDDLVRGRALLDKVLATKGADFKKEAEHLKKTRFTDAAIATAARAAKAKLAVAPPEPPASRLTPQAASAAPPPPAAPPPAAPSSSPPVTLSSALAKVAALEPVSTPKSDLNGHDHDDEHEEPRDPPAAATATASGAVAAAKVLKPLLVLPERPPLGTPSRKVIVIRHEKTDAESTIRFRISGEVGVLRGDVPAADGAGRRIFYDVAPAKLGQRNIEPIEVKDGVVARVRAGQYDTDVVRLVIELEGDQEPSLFISKKPFELVLSSPWSGGGATMAIASSSAPAGAAASALLPADDTVPPSVADVVVRSVLVGDTTVGSVSVVNVCVVSAYEMPAALMA